MFVSEKLIFAAILGTCATALAVAGFSISPGGIHITIPQTDERHSNNENRRGFGLQWNEEENRERGFYFRVSDDISVDSFRDSEPSTESSQTLESPTPTDSPTDTTDRQ